MTHWPWLSLGRKFARNRDIDVLLRLSEELFHSTRTHEEIESVSVLYTEVGGSTLQPFESKQHKWEKYSTWGLGKLVCNV
jgi:hypothetical protein